MTNTKLIEKNYSPLIVRKYMVKGWPTYVSLICDVSLSDLDEVVNGIVKDYDFQDDIQSLRDFCGKLNETIVNYYNEKKEGCVEGVAVLSYFDKLFISSLWGDFMVHASCKQELFAIIQTLPHI